MEQILKTTGIRSFPKLSAMPDHYYNESVDRGTSPEVKLARIDKYNKLSTAAQTVLYYVCCKEKTADLVDLTHAKMSNFLGRTANVKKYFRLAITELLEEDIIARSYKADHYWLNRRFIWI